MMDESEALCFFCISFCIEGGHEHKERNKGRSLTKTKPSRLCWTTTKYKKFNTTNLILKSLIVKVISNRHKFSVKILTLSVNRSVKVHCISRHVSAPIPFLAPPQPCIGMLEHRVGWTIIMGVAGLTIKKSLFSHKTTSNYMYTHNYCLASIQSAFYE